MDYLSYFAMNYTLPLLDLAERPSKHTLNSCTVARSIKRISSPLFDSTQHNRHKKSQTKGKAKASFLKYNFLMIRKLIPNFDDLISALWYAILPFIYEGTDLEACREEGPWTELFQRDP